MKYIIVIILLFFIGNTAKTQSHKEYIEGKITYITSNNVYVKFQSMDGVNIGDTLFVKIDQNYKPLLVVNNVSSTSSVGTLILSIDISVSMSVYAQKSTQALSVQKTAMKNDTIIDIPINTIEESLVKDNTKLRQQDVYGKIAVNSYSFFSNSDSLISNTQRFKYNLSLNVRNIQGSRLSIESYISFSHKLKEWDRIKENIFNGLKIYDFSLNYDFGNGANMWLGRKINRRISNIGAVDGIQFEKKFDSFVTGVVVGFRPDWEDYGFNKDLFQYGIYLGHNAKTESGYAETSVAFFNQKNNGQTDRRLLYIQHSNTLAKNLFLFGSGEIDLYQKIDEIEESVAKLTNLYMSLRYRVDRKLTLSFSYSARNNVIYYETYKNFIDQLLDEETRQGYALSTTLRPANNLTFGLKVGYRSRPKDIRGTKNLHTFFSIRRIPNLEISATISATLLETSYLKSKIFGLRLSKDLIPNKLYSGLNYRYVNYTFVNNENGMTQHIVDASLNLKIDKKFFISLNYEKTFEKQLTLNRLYINLTQRF